MSQELTAAHFDGICRDASANPNSSKPITWNEESSILEDYLYTVWIKVADRLQWDNPMLFPKEDSQSNSQWLQASVFRLVGENQTTPFDITQILNKYLPKD